MKHSIANNCFRLGIALLPAMLLSASPFFAEARDADPVAETIEHNSKGRKACFTALPT